MNVLLLSTHLNVGGVGLYIVNVAKTLKERGHAVVVSSSGGSLVDELGKAGIEHFFIDIKTKSELSPKLIFAYPKLLAFIHERRIDVVHAHTRVAQVLAFFLAKGAKISYVSTCHGFFKRRLGRRIFKCWGEKTIAISQAVRDHLIRDFNVKEKDVELVFNGVDAGRFCRVYKDEEKRTLRRELGIKEKTVVGAIGRLSSVKGYEYLIEAMDLLVDRGEDIRLVIVGDGPEKARLRALTDEYGLYGKVTFVEPTLDTPRMLSIMDIFVSSSTQEGLGLSVAEALASGKPVIASDVGGVGSLIKDRETGMLVSPENGKAIADAVSILTKDRELRNRLAAAGQELVKEDFALGCMVDGIEKVYREVA